MKAHYMVFIFAGFVLAACDTTRRGNSAIMSVPFSDILANPKLYEGQVVETQCLLVNDHFETHLLMRSLKTPVDCLLIYSFSKSGERDEVGQKQLGAALADSRVASVTIQGRVSIYPKAMPYGRNQFVIDKIVSAKSQTKRPNKALVPTPASVTPAADAPVAPDAGAAHL